MFRRSIGGTLLFALVSVVSSPAIGAERTARPNFIVINIDDLGYADIGPYGSPNATPHLDRLAREGRKLTSHYAAHLCSPSRAALMTGCYAKRVLPMPGVLFPANPVGLHPDEVTLAELLKAAGYATACIGKWHLGDQPEFLPTRQGFDYYFGIPYSNDMGPPADGAKSNLGQPIPQPANVQGKGYPPLPLLENEKVIERVRAAEQATLTRRYTERAVKFVHQNNDGPFFLYLAHTAVHFPHYPATEFVGKSKTGLIGDWTLEVDWSVGQVLDAVRQLKLDEKTLVLFTSDNGGALNHGSNNAPLRGSKGSTLEGGIRTCTLAWWPGQIPAGTSTDAMTSMMDILPTLVRLGGGSLPSDRKLDGVDLWPVLTGAPGSQPPRDSFYYFRGLRLEAVRRGPWKLHLQEGELYNLEDDIGEANDISVAHRDVVAELRALANAMERDLGISDLGPGCRPLGRVENPQPLINHEGMIRAAFEAPR
jgi:arylsulfatase A